MLHSYDHVLLNCHADLLTHYESGGIWAMADGSVRYCGASANTSLLEKLAFLDDRTLTEQEVNALWNYNGYRRVRWEGYLAIAAFLFVAVLPVFWLF